MCKLQVQQLLFLLVQGHFDQKQGPTAGLQTVMNSFRAQLPDNPPTNPSHHSTHVPAFTINHPDEYTGALRQHMIPTRSDYNEAHGSGIESGRTSRSHTSQTDDSDDDDL